MIKKVLKGILIFFAALIALAYTFGYDYLFKGIRETYLRGKNSATIDDAKYFPSHIIAKGKSIPWVQDSLYNKKSLPENLVEDLNQSNTASFIVIKNGKLLHEQ